MSAQRSAIENAWAETGENFCEVFLDKFSSPRYAHATAALLPGRKRAGVLKRPETQEAKFWEELVKMAEKNFFDFTLEIFANFHPCVGGEFSKTSTVHLTCFFAH
ncbi:hypothetical protein T09_12654 [Trichinella sp. T9]|nr:hypothetical protein T09_12654 [Trichinella sp. T9]